jgi:hypothetical protein
MAAEQHLDFGVADVSSSMMIRNASREILFVISTSCMVAMLT